jgi:hypothetical protein
MSEIQRFDLICKGFAEGYGKVEPIKDGAYVLYTYHLDALAKKERGKDELLANQRRRMGAEYDELYAELKRVRIVAAEQIAALTAKYNELIMEVSCKQPHETRHETALRYIHERDRGGDNIAKAALKEAV